MIAYNKSASTVYYGDASHYLEFARKQSNPSGCPGAHSGHTWLHDTLGSPGELLSIGSSAQKRLNCYSKGMVDFIA
eukprot:5888050-Pyramimonas_sp.AAC.1